MSQLTIPTAFIPLELTWLGRDFLLKEFEQATGLKLQSDKHTKRKRIEYGYDFDLLCEGDKLFKPFPNEIRQLRDAAVESLGCASTTLPPAQQFTQAIASYYEHGYQLQPHIDVDRTQSTKRGREFDFHFGDQIIGITLQADTSGRFYVMETGDRKADYDPAIATHLDEKDGTVFLLEGENRTKRPHGVSMVENKRITLTLRTVEFR